MTTRKATVDDIPAIQRLYRELDKHHVDLLPDVFRALSEDARPDSVIREWIEGADADYLLAEVDGNIVGFLNIRRAGNPEYPMFQPREFALIESAVVEQAQRGHGVGSTLFDAAIAWAKEYGLAFVQTTVWSANHRTREFYLKKGFKAITEKLELNLRDRTAEQTQAPDA